MKDIAKLLTASEDILSDNDPEDIESKQFKLATRLESEGKKPICVGRAIITIERSETFEEAPLQGQWGVLKLSIYSDPDVSGNETPEILYISGSRWGLGELIYKNQHSTQKLK